jgi:WD40 repeat protein
MNIHLKHSLVRLVTVLWLVATATLAYAQKADQPPKITVNNAGQILPVKYLSYGAIRGILWSPTGNLLAIPSSLGTWIYDTADFDKLPHLFGNNHNVVAVAFSPDGSLLASIDSPNPYLISGNQCFTDTVHIWDVATGKERFSLSTQTVNSNKLAFSPDGTWLATGSSNDNTIRLWSLKTGQMETVFKQGPGTILGLAFNSNGSILASVGDSGKIWLWHVDQGTKYDILSTQGELLVAIAFSPDGSQLVTEDSAGIIQFRQATTGELIGTLNLEIPQEYTLLYSPDSKWLVADNKLLNVSERTQEAVLSGRFNAFSSDAKYLASASESDVTLRILSSRQERHILEGFSAGITSLTFSRDEESIISTDQSNIRIWNLANTALLRHISVPETGASVVAASPDLSIIASMYENTVYIRSPLSNKQDVELKTEVADWEDQGVGDHYAHLNNLLFSPDGKIIAFASKYDRQIQLLDTLTGKPLSRPLKVEGHIKGLAFDGDGKQLAALVDRTPVKIFSSVNGATLNSLKQPVDMQKTPESVTFSKDGKIVAAGGWQRVYLWDASTGRI